MEIFNKILAPEFSLSLVFDEGKKTAFSHVNRLTLIVVLCLKCLCLKLFQMEM